MATILVVDDEPALRAFAVRILRSGGWRVLEAADGSEALAVITQYAGTIDLLLTDVQMPALDGRELDKRVRREHPQTKVLFMSGYTDTNLPPDAEFLPKPFTLQELTRKVREALVREDCGHACSE